MTITLSISDITDSIYAASALETFLTPGDEAPKVLHRDQAPMLARIIRDSFAYTALDLSRFCTRIDIDGDPDLLRLEVHERFDDAVPAGILTAQIRVGVSVLAQSSVWQAVNLPRSNHLFNDWRRIMDGIARQLTVIQLSLVGSRIQRGDRP